MVSFGYVWHELRQRWSRTLVTALGLAMGVGLVMGIVGVSNGLSNTQTKVLSPLSSVGTSIIVERTVGVANTSAHYDHNDHHRGGRWRRRRWGGGGGFFGGLGASGANASDSAALSDNNSSVLTDLAKLGPPGTQFSNDFFVNGTLITFPQLALSDISKIKGVDAAVPALSLQALHETGTVPTISAASPPVGRP